MPKPKVERFSVKSDTDGQVYVAVAYQLVELIRPRGYRATLPDPVISFKLEDDDRDLNPIEGDRKAFKIGDTNEIVRKL